MAIKPAETKRTQKRPANNDFIFLGLYLRNIVANLFSFVVIILLNAFTPLSFFKSRKACLLE